MVSNSMDVLARFRPQLVAEARTLRESGASWDLVAQFLSNRSKTTVGRAAVQAYFTRGNGVSDDSDAAGEES